MDPYLITDADITVRLISAMLLGSLLGIERLFAGKTAGMRTYALVSMGSAVFVLVQLTVSEWYVERTSFDPLRMASQIVVGVGFLGAGLIIFKDRMVRGLTTAAGLWLAAGIGMSVGFGLYHIAILTTLLTLFVFSVLGVLKQRIDMVTKRLQFLDTSDSEDDI